MNFSMQTRNWFHSELYFFVFLMYCTFTIFIYKDMPYEDIAFRFIIFSPVGFFIGYALSRINHHTLELEDDIIILNDDKTFYLNQVEKVYFGNYSYIQSFEEKDGINPEKLKSFHNRQKLKITEFYERGPNFGKDIPYLIFKEGEDIRGVNVSGFSYEKMKEFISMLEKRDIPIEINKKSFKKLL
jgi:hypothetical protein